MGTRAERLNSSRTQYNDYKDTLPYIFFPACKQHNATIHDNILPRRKMDSHCIKLSILPACYNLLNLSISSRCNKSVKIRFVATCHNNLTQPETPQIVGTTCTQLETATDVLQVVEVVNKLQQVCENQTCCTLIFAELLQVVETICIKLVDKKS